MLEYWAVLSDGSPTRPLTKSCTLITIVIVVAAAPSGAQPACSTQRAFRSELLTVAIVPSIDLIRQFPTNSLRQSPSLLLIKQLLHLTSTGTTIVDLLAPDQSFWRAWVDAFPDFSFPVEVGEGDVEAMHMRWDDCQKEEDTIEYDILVETREHHNRKGRKEYIKDADD